MSSARKATGFPSPALVFDTLFAYQRTAALRAAIELDLFRAIGEGPGDVASLARRSSASERGTRILCDFLTVIGLLSKTEGRYSNTETSAAAPGSTIATRRGPAARSRSISAVRTTSCCSRTSCTTSIHRPASGS